MEVKYFRILDFESSNKNEFKNLNWPLSDLITAPRSSAEHSGDFRISSQIFLPMAMIFYCWIYECSGDYMWRDLVNVDFVIAFNDSNLISLTFYWCVKIGSFCSDFYSFWLRLRITSILSMMELNSSSGM